jgi:hypothetical protein
MTAVGTALAIEVTAAAVRVLRLGGLGRWRRARGYAERGLPAGLVLPSATAPNVQDEPAFAKLLTEVVGPRPPRRARLVLPDRVLRLHVLELEGAPPEGQALRPFLLWRLWYGTLPVIAVCAGLLPCLGALASMLPVCSTTSWPPASSAGPSSATPGTVATACGPRGDMSDIVDVS